MTTAVSRPAGLPKRSLPKGRLSTWLVWACVAFFLVNLFALILSVVVNSFGTKWFAGWLPQSFTTAWYTDAWDEFALGDVLTVTLEITLIVVALALLIGVPAGYALARRDFPASGS